MNAPVLLLVLVAAPAGVLSKVVPPKGVALAHEFTFADKAGPHLVRFELTDVKSRRKKGEDLDFRSQTLTVTHTVGHQDVWTAKDFVEDCEFDLSLELLEGSIEVTDLDDDGESEVSFAYRLACRSDVSPKTAKLLMYEGKTKYAVRGNSRERVGENEFMGGESTVDPAFKKAPAKFLEFAQTKWKRWVVAEGERP